MCEELLIKHCSPTLAGIKTGNMFSCSYDCVNTLREDIRKINRRFVKKGLRVLPLRITDQKALIYVFRPLKLKNDLTGSLASSLLQSRGYICANADSCVARLVRRLSESEDFPHEIGLFLGYPPEDVKGFIEKGAKDCKICGCWKVYGDEEKARCLFARYKRCTDEYMRLLSVGTSLDRLVVPERSIC